jgi:hypothetical protein
MVEVQPERWREELLAVLEGRHVDNQAIGYKATKSYEPLRFRSASEVRIAQALDRAGVMYLPNCKARVGSVERRRNSEADFLICANGSWGILEVDGSEWHPPQRAAEDHLRDGPFKRHGAAAVERFDAGDCFENPDGRRRALPRAAESVGIASGALCSCEYAMHLIPSGRSSSTQGCAIWAEPVRGWRASADPLLLQPVVDRRFGHPERLGDLSDSRAGPRQVDDLPARLYWMPAGH